MTKSNRLAEQIEKKFKDSIKSVAVAHDEVNVEVDKDNILDVLNQLKTQKEFAFDELIDLCAVDYLDYGVYDWQTDCATETGFSRGVEAQPVPAVTMDKPRFAVVYHLLSTVNNQRVRVKVFLEGTAPVIPSAHEIWKAVNWFEREAYDLYGILFEGHPDLRRILTDYGFIGFPFRKDFPISGHVEMRYDASLKKVIYEPVEIEPRVLVPKVIREDNRYMDNQGSKQ